MPVIDVDLHETELVDARVILTFTRLTSMLRRVIDESNTHHHEIEELKRQLKEERDRGDELDTLVKGKGDRRKSMADISKHMDAMRSEIDALRDDVDRNRTTAQEGLKSRVEVLESSVDAHGSRLDRDFNEHKEATAKATKGVKDLEERLAKLKLPDLVPLEKRCTALEQFQDLNKGKIDTANHFVECWSADPAKLQSLCERQRSLSRHGSVVNSPTTTHSPGHMALANNAESGGGAAATSIGGDVSSSNNNSGASSPRRPGTAASNQVPSSARASVVALPPMPYMRSDEDRTAYLLSLPPFQDTCNQYKACDEFQRAALEAKLSAMGAPGRPGAGDGVTKAELAKMQQELKTQGSAVRNGLDFMERRLKDGEGLLNRVGAVEEDCKYLHRGKADIGLIDMKADRDAVVGVNRQISDVRDDINDILDRMLRGGGAPSSPNSTTTTTVVSATPRGDDLRRRVGDLESEATRLETKKANREELQRFYQFLEAVDPEAVRRKSNSVGGLLPGGGGSGGATATGNGYGNGNGSENGGVRRSTSNSRGNENGDVRRSTSTSRCPGGTLNGAGSCGHDMNGQNNTFTPRRPGTVPADVSRVGSNSPGRAGGGEWEVRPSAATKGTPMRVFMGRSVATVRDSGGHCVPASIGSPEHYRYVSE